MEKIRDVTVVGGSDIGLLTGLAVQKLNPELDVAVVDDFSEEPTDTAKSTFEGIVDLLHDFLDIEETRLIKQVKPVFKMSLYFRNWGDCEPFHHPFDHTAAYPDEADPLAAEKYFHLYDDVMRNTAYRTRNATMVEERKAPFTIAPSGGIETYRPYAYHFNTRRLNAFLRTLCEERGVGLVDDRVTDVHASGGRIDRVEGEEGTYESDLYVDASGFSRLLRRELDDDFKAFEFPLDSAFNTRVERDLSEVIPATIVETGDYGWYWHIDTHDHRDFGYVFSSDHVSDDEALSEFMDYWDIEDPDYDVRKYEFDSGYYRNAWEGNCVAIGNAGGFIEPLQSTSLTANMGLATTLSSLLAAHDHTNHRGLRDSYNGYAMNIWEAIYDFLFMHYKYSSGDTDLWDAMGELEGTPRAQRIVDEYDKNGIISHGFLSLNSTSALVESPDYGQDLVWNLDYPLFPVQGYYGIMRKMGAESSFYEADHIDVSDAAKAQIDETYESMQEEVDVLLTTEELYQLV